MGTTCRLYVERECLRYIDVSFDGHISSAGKVLLEHYSTDDKVENLLTLGDLAYLAASTEAPAGHTFNNPVEGCCVSYGRDRYFNTYGPKLTDHISLIRELLTVP